MTRRKIGGRQRYGKIITSRAFNAAIYAICIFSGALTIAYCVNRALLASRSSGWAQTDGQIVASHIARAGKNGGVIYLKVLYRYRVGESIYNGDEVSYGFSGAPFGEGLQTAEAKAALYPTGAKAAVYFHPSAPAVSCLETGGDWQGYGYPVAVATSFVLFGLRGLWRQLPGKRRIRPRRAGGVNIRLAKAEKIDAKREASMLKTYGTAIGIGREARVTKIKFKGKRLEFQLDGGGFDDYTGDPYVGGGRKIRRRTEFGKVVKRRKGRLGF